MAAIAGIGASALLQFVQGLGSNTPAPTASTAAPDAPKKAGGAHRRHGHGAGGLKQIQSAVLNALQSAKTAAGATSATGSISNPDQVIQDAISKILKSQFAAPSTGSSGAEASGGTTSPPQTFEDILQSFGVTPQQFENDFSAAVKEAQNGQSNAGSAFQNIQPGALLDVTG